MIETNIEKLDRHEKLIRYLSLISFGQFILILALLFKVFPIMGV